MSEKSPCVIENIVNNVHRNYILDGDADIIDYMVKACEQVRNQTLIDVEKIVENHYLDCLQHSCCAEVVKEEIKNLKVKK